MSEPNGYLIHGTAFSSKEAAFKALVSNHEQESWFHKIWDEDAQPYYFESQPQLTIPKSIAEMVDKQKTTKLKFDDYDNEFFPYFKWSTEFDKQHGKFSSSYLLEAYLAGKALGVDLVKVGEG